jgi:hypothetical protein
MQFEYSLGDGRGSLILAEVHGLPLALNDARANLRWSFSFAGLLGGVDIFAYADAATGAVFADEAIKKAFVALAAITVAVAGLLVQNFFDVAGEGIGILDYRVRKIIWTHGRR